jgi:hypothetical protein
MNIKVYQMKDGEKYHGRRFRELPDDVSEVDLRDYDLVYDGELAVQSPDSNDIKALDYLYHKLNVGEKPISYFGHSLSVSDLVSLDGPALLLPVHRLEACCRYDQDERTSERWRCCQIGGAMEMGDAAGGIYRDHRRRNR